MNFDQMMDAWRSQDEAPLNGVNQDLLQIVLQHEQTDLRRKLRREQWTTYVVGIGMAILAGFWLWVSVVRGAPVHYTLAAAVSTGAFALWIGAFSLSRRRQKLREQGYGNTLKEEIGRNLSLIEYELSRAGRWSASMLRSAPVTVGAVLIYWLMAEINDNTDLWFDLAIIVFVIVSMVTNTRSESRKVRKELEPRRKRLRELLEKLEA